MARAAHIRWSAWRDKLANTAQTILTLTAAPLDRWCRLYRKGGAEALKPKPKGRPKGAKAKPRELTREQELEERCRRLEAEVAYLKKLRALVERDGL